MLLELLFPIWLSPDDKGGGGDDTDDVDDEEELEDEEDEEEVEDEEEDEDLEAPYNKKLALDTIRKQRVEYRELKKTVRAQKKELDALKKQNEDKDKTEVQLAKDEAKTSTARAEKAENALKEERVKSAIIRVAAMTGMRDPEDAYLNLKDSGNIEFEDEEELIIDMDSVKGAVEALKKSKPYLFEEAKESDDDEEDDEDLGGSPIRRKVRSRIKKAQKEDAEKKRKAAEALKPDIVVSSKF